MIIILYRNQQLDSPISGSSLELEKFKDVVNQSSCEIFTRAPPHEANGQKYSIGHQKKKAKLIQGTVHSGRRHYRKGEINYLVGFDTLFWLIPEALG